LSSAVEPVKKEEERQEPVAGPSSPRLHAPPSTPPPPSPKQKVKQTDSGVLDLTLSDSDDDVLDLTHSPVRPLPKSAKARGKQPAAPPRASTPPPAPPSKPREEDFSRIAWSADDLAENEEPENVLNTLSLDELSALGKRMKVQVPAGRATVRSFLSYTFSSSKLTFHCTQRNEWTKALLKTSNQSTLSFFAAPPPPSSTAAVKGKKSKNAPLMKRSTSGSIGVGYDAKGKKLTQSTVVVRQALAILGAFSLSSPCLSQQILIFFSHIRRSRHSSPPFLPHPLRPHLSNIPPHFLHRRLHHLPHVLPPRPLRQAPLPHLRRLPFLLHLPLPRRLTPLRESG
jgi:hypothetical protein